jgi:cytochrome P450
MTPPPRMSGVSVLREMKRDVLGTLERARREHGDLVLLEAGPPLLRSRIHACFHPDAVRRVMATEAGRYRKDNRFYKEVRWGLGDGLLTSQDERWKRQRRFVQPLFTRKRIATYADGMGAEAEELAAQWRVAARAGTPIDLHAEMSRVTLRIVGRLLFGADVERALGVVAYAFAVVGEDVRRRAYNPLSPPRGWPLPSNRRAARTQDAARAACDELIAERRAGETAGDDLMGMLIAARDGDEALDDTEIRDQVLVFLLAGHDTTAIALTFALHLLGHDREAQERVRAEVAEVAGDRTPGAADVERLTYTTMVLKEAMRLYPPVWGVGRRVAGGDVIGGHAIAPGSDIMVSPWVTHRHPEFWESPERFDPERFAPAAEAERHRHAYFPFGAGPRACIAQYFSMLEAAIVLAVIVRDHELASVDDRVPLAPKITLHPAAPVLSRLKPVARVARRAVGVVQGPGGGADRGLGRGAAP